MLKVGDKVRFTIFYKETCVGIIRKIEGNKIWSDWGVVDARLTYADDWEVELIENGIQRAIKRLK